MRRKKKTKPRMSETNSDSGKLQEVVCEATQSIPSPPQSPLMFFLMDVFIPPKSVFQRYLAKYAFWTEKVLNAAKL